VLSDDRICAAAGLISKNLYLHQNPNTLICFTAFFNGKSDQFANLEPIKLDVYENPCRNGGGQVSSL